MDEFEKCFVHQSNGICGNLGPHNSQPQGYNSSQIYKDTEILFWPYPLNAHKFVLKEMIFKKHCDLPPYTENMTCKTYMTS